MLAAGRDSVMIPMRNSGYEEGMVEASTRSHRRASGTLLD
jgi:hypothetical protein